MKVLTAERGERPDDFAFTVPDELVSFGYVCDLDREAEQGDGGCGCRRSFAGLVSGRGTTLAVVSKTGYDEATYRRMVAESLSGILPADEADQEASHALAVAGAYPVGTRLRRDLDTISVDMS